MTDTLIRQYELIKSQSVYLLLIHQSIRFSSVLINEFFNRYICYESIQKCVLNTIEKFYIQFNLNCYLFMTNISLHLVNNFGISFKVTFCKAYLVFPGLILFSLIHKIPLSKRIVLPSVSRLPFILAYNILSEKNCPRATKFHYNENITRNEQKVNLERETAIFGTFYYIAIYFQ